MNKRLLTALAPVALLIGGDSASAQDSNPVHFGFGVGLVSPGEHFESQDQLGPSLMLSTVVRGASSRLEFRFDGIRNRMPSRGAEPTRRMQGGSLGASYDLLARATTPYIGAGVGIYYVGAGDVSTALKSGKHLALGWRTLAGRHALFAEARSYTVTGGGSASPLLTMLVGWRR